MRPRPSRAFNPRPSMRNCGEHPSSPEVDMSKRFWILAAAAALLAAPSLAQQEHAHTHGAAEALGTVNFPTSCKPEVAADFTRAIALLHSFGYEESRRAFEDVAREGSRVRHGVLGDRDDLLPPDLGARRPRRSWPRARPRPRRRRRSARRPTASAPTSPRSAPSTATPDPRAARAQAFSDAHGGRGRAGSRRPRSARSSTRCPCSAPRRRATRPSRTRRRRPRS